MDSDSLSLKGLGWNCFLGPRCSSYDEQASFPFVPYLFFIALGQNQHVKTNVRGWQILGFQETHTPPEVDPVYGWQKFCPSLGEGEACAELHTQRALLWCCHSPPGFAHTGQAASPLKAVSLLSDHIPGSQASRLFLSISPKPTSRAHVGLLFDSVLRVGMYNPKLELWPSSGSARGTDSVEALVTQDGIGMVGEGQQHSDGPEIGSPYAAIIQCPTLRCPRILHLNLAFQGEKIYLISPFVSWNFDFSLFRHMARVPHGTLTLGLAYIRNGFAWPL